MKLLIDGDAIVFKAAAPADGRTYVTKEGEEFKYKKDALAATSYPDDLILEYRPEPPENAMHNAKLLMDKICDTALEEGWREEGEDVCVYLKGDGSNFRKDLDPEYKRNREGMRRPFHEATVVDWLQRHYDYVMVDGQEVDDALGIAQDMNNTVIVSHDKDLNMVPGHHIYIAYSGELEAYVVDEETGLRQFYQQLLTGDSTDNIPGLHKIGPKTAIKLLSGTETEVEMFTTVRDKYEEKGVPEDRMITNGNLLWIRQKEGQQWKPPGLTEAEST